MNLAPRWLRASFWLALLTMLIAISKPPVAPLLLRAMVVIALTAAAVAGLTGALRDVEPVSGSGRRADPVEPNAVPRELAMMTEELRQIGRRGDIPPGVIRNLRNSLQHRLWYRHGLAVTSTAHSDAIRALLSPNGWLVAAT
ncbi:MAG: hypothetical protein ABIQ39_13195, partial [Ilumatobacteraceae bacterium]